jgi:hypothetical protein
MWHLRSALLYKQRLCQQLSPGGVFMVLQPRRFSNVTERTVMRAGGDEFVIYLCTARGGGVHRMMGVSRMPTLRHRVGVSSVTAYL